MGLKHEGGCGLPALLAADALPAVLDHLLALDADDRYGRFATSLSDAGIAAYVARLAPQRDIGLVTRGAGGTVTGFLHLAVCGHRAELGASVAAPWRQRGIARTLFAAAVTHAIARGIEEIELATAHPVAQRIFGKLGYACRLQPTYPRGLISLALRPA